MFVLAYAQLTQTAETPSNEGSLLCEGYYVGPTVLDFNGSKSYCENQGDVLAMIKSAEDQSRAAVACQAHSCWIGLLEDKNVQGTWSWIDLAPLSYSNWEAGQPDNWDGKDEKHATMNCCWEYAPASMRHGTWFDVPATLTVRPLCMS
eukprot:gene13901-4073_t